jgi:hypothetical protein
MLGELRFEALHRLNGKRNFQRTFQVWVSFAAVDWLHDPTLGGKFRILSYRVGQKACKAGTLKPLMTPFKGECWSEDKVLT